MGVQNAIESCRWSSNFSEENGFTEPTDVSRPNKHRIAPYWPRLRGATRGGERPGAARGQLAPSVGGVAPWRPAVRAERVEVGTARRLPGVVLVNARGADNGQPARFLPW